MLGCFWDRFVTAWNSVQNGASWCNWCKSSCHDVTWGFFSTNAPNPLHWTLNSCFGVLHSIWIHLGSFRNCMKLDAKQGELVQLMQKFMPRSHIGIFHNECTQSAPLDPKLMFWCISFRSGAFWTVSLLHETWCKMRQTGAINAKVRATMPC